MRNNRTGWMKLLRVMAWILFGIIVLFGLVYGSFFGLPWILLIVPLAVLLAFCLVAGFFLKLDLLEDYHSMRLSLEAIERSLRGKGGGGTPGGPVEEALALMEDDMEDGWEEETDGEEPVYFNGQLKKRKEIEEKDL
ncbi:MAG TPA: hypothetical protein H9749_00035 [Candidatus Acutalibacter stercorigallinarum]|nr:hypothetical protein [Candidatus Acutalibacter stercorigallinarum]